jgi:hypothetical protein
MKRHLCLLLLLAVAPVARAAPVPVVTPLPAITGPFQVRSLVLYQTSQTLTARLGPQGVPELSAYISRINAAVAPIFAAAPVQAGVTGILYAGIVLLSLGQVGSPAIRALLSQSVDARRQGEVQGALSGLQALMSIAAPLTMGAIFAGATMPGAALHFPGAPFVLSGAVCLVSVLALKK